MIAGNVFAAEFPQSGIEIPNVDYVARAVTDLYAIAHSERLANEDVNPGDEAFHRRLHSEPNASLRKSGRNLVVLRSLEMNLSRSGEGDMSAEALSALDLVVGSFHSSLRTVEDQTDRYLAALRNPDVQILGHPRG